jgi:hypothetical protein
MKYYWQAIFEQEPMVVAWELFVLFMLLMFISIIFRLARIERNQQIILTVVTKNKKPRLKRKAYEKEFNRNLLWWVRNNNTDDVELEYDKKN